MSPDIPIHLILQMGEAIQLARYICVAAYTIQVYEWLICFSDEYLYVHKARWSSVKFAYLFCRYYPLIFFAVIVWAWVGNHPISLCTKVVPAILAILPLFNLSAQPVFIIRTYAFTGRNKFLLAFLLTCWLVQLGCRLWIQNTKWTFIRELQMMFGVTGCFITEDLGGQYNPQTSKPDASMTLTLFLFDSLMTVIVFVHCIRFRTLWGPLGKSFVVQTVMAYVMLSTLNLALLIVLFEPEYKYDSIGIFPGPTADLIACRLILMLRRRADLNATTQIQRQSQLDQDAIDRLEAMEDVDDEKLDPNQPIEHWD